jgi:hypothetical protein
MIMRADESFLELPNLLACLEQIQQGCEEGDCQTIKNILSEVVGGFSEMPINDILWRRNQQQSGMNNLENQSSAKITPLLRKSSKKKGTD